MLQAQRADGLMGFNSTAYRGATATSSGRTIGIKGVAGNATTGYNYAIYGVLSGTNYGAAIYGVVPGKGDIYVDGLYAGYFRGNVKMENDLTVLGTFIPSDINLKKDIQNLDIDNLAKIRQLQAIRYKLKTPVELNQIRSEVSDTSKSVIATTDLNDPIYQREYIGLSAQSIQQLYPEVVKVESNGTLSVNYTALIPVLIKAIKEQQTYIENLEIRINALSSKIPQ